MERLIEMNKSWNIEKVYVGEEGRQGKVYYPSFDLDDDEMYDLAHQAIELALDGAETEIFGNDKSAVVIVYAGGKEYAVYYVK